MSEYDYDSKSDSESDDCIHDSIRNIEGTSICMSCGLKVKDELIDNDRYYGANDSRHGSDPSRHNQRANEKRGVYADLQELGIEPDIIDKADEYYNKLTEDGQIYRGAKRTSIILACTYYAYSSKKIYRSIDELCKLFKLDKKKFTQGNKIFNSTFKKLEAKKTIVAMDLVPELLDTLHKVNIINLEIEPGSNIIDESKKQAVITDIEKIYNYMCVRTKTITRANPKSVAIGLLYFYLNTIKKKNISREDYEKISKIDIKIEKDAYKYIHWKQ